MHYLLKAIMIHIGLVLGLGNMQWSQSKFISTYQEVQSINFSLLNFSIFVSLEIVYKSFFHFYIEVYRGKYQWSYLLVLVILFTGIDDFIHWYWWFYCLIDFLIDVLIDV